MQNIEKSRVVPPPFPLAHTNVEADATYLAYRSSAISSEAKPDNTPL